MNNVLDYKGYRLFQSSYDKDELGTVLSVNHDFWGTLVSYLGYFFMTLGMILNMFSKKTRFALIKQKLKDCTSMPQITEDSTLKSKINKVYSILESYKEKEIDTDLIELVLKTQELVEEIENDDNIS